VLFSLVNRVTTSSWGNSSCTHNSNAISTAKPMFSGSSNSAVIPKLLSGLTESDNLRYFMAAILNSDFRCGVAMFGVEEGKNEKERKYK